MKAHAPALLVILLAKTAFAQDEAEVGDTEIEMGVGSVEDEEIALDAEPTEPTVPPVDVEAVVRRATAARKDELTGAAYEFCTDPSYEPRGFKAQRFCKMVGPEMESTCPAIARTCYKEPETAPFRLPDAVLYTLLVLALLALGGGLGWFLVTLLRQSRRREQGPLEIRIPSPVSVTLDTLPETEAMTLLYEAELRLAAGQVGEAALILHVAALRHFDDAGLITFHPSTTNGEYLRMLRRERELMLLFRGIAELTDRLRFGDGVVDRSELESLIGAAKKHFVRPSSNRPGPAVAAAGIAALLTFSGCDGKDTSFFSHRPEGLAALPALLTAAGIETKTVRKKPPELPENAGVVVFRTDYVQRDLTREEIDEILDTDRAVIVLDDAHRPQGILPVTSTVAFADLAEFPRAVDLLVTDEYFCRFDQASFREQVLDPIPGPLRIPAGFAHTTRPEEEPVSTPEHTMELVPLLAYAEAPRDAPKVVAYGAIRLNPSGEPEPGCLAFFSTSEPFSNAALASEKNAAYAAGLIASFLDTGESVVFIDSLEPWKGESSNVSSSLSNSKMLPLLLHAGLWVAVLFIALGAAFGRLRDPMRTEHKAFLEHAQAVGLYYAASGEAGQVHATEALARLVVAKYRHRVRGGTEEAWVALAGHLAERHLLERREVLSALSSGLDAGVRARLQTELLPLAPVRALAVLSTILAGEARVNQKGP